MDKGERWNPRGGRRRRRSWQEPLPPSPAASSLLPPSGGQVAQCSSTSLHQVAPMDPRLSIPTSAAGYDVAARALSSSNSTTDVRFQYSGRLLSRASDAAQASSFTTNTFLGGDVSSVDGWLQQQVHSTLSDTRQVRAHAFCMRFEILHAL